MSKIQAEQKSKEVLFIVALFSCTISWSGLCPFTGFNLSLTIGHPFLAINSRITHTSPNIRCRTRIRHERGTSHRGRKNRNPVHYIFHCRYHRFGIVLTGKLWSTKTPDSSFPGDRHLWRKCHCRLGSVIKAKTRTSPWPWEPFSCLTPWHYLSPADRALAGDGRSSIRILVRYCHPRHEFRGRYKTYSNEALALSPPRPNWSGHFGSSRFHWSPPSSIIKEQTPNQNIHSILYFLSTLSPWSSLPPTRRTPQWGHLTLKSWDS